MQRFGTTGAIIGLFVLAAAGPADARHHSRHRDRRGSWPQQNDIRQGWAQQAAAAAPPRTDLKPGCRLRFLGANGGVVTGSMTLLETRGGTMLVDCGVVQEGPGSERRSLPPEAVHADAMVLTHGHADHNGLVPLAVKQGFKGDVHCTPATADQCKVTWLSTARHMQSTARDEGGAPLFNEHDVKRAVKRLRTHDFGERFSPVSGAPTVFFPAGHLPGAASVEVSVEVNVAVSPTQRRNVVFSGDIGRKGDILTQDPVPPRDADYVLMEHTYGDRVHDRTVSVKEQLAKVAQDIEARGSIAVFPSLSQHRTQVLAVLLKQLKLENRLHCRVTVDSPSGKDMTDVCRRHSETWSKELLQFAKQHGDPFDVAHYVANGAESQVLTGGATSGPAIIITSPGMPPMELGPRSTEHILAAAGDPSNTIVIPSWQYPGSLGRALADGDKTVEIDGKVYPIEARVKVLQGASAHADRPELLEWAAAVGGRNVKQFFLNHGEANQTPGMVQAMRARGMQVSVPRLGEVVELQ